MLAETGTCAGFACPEGNRPCCVNTAKLSLPLPCRALSQLTIDTLKSEVAFNSVRAVLFEAPCQRVLSNGGTFKAAAVCGQQLTPYAAAGVSLTQQGSSWQLRLPAAQRRDLQGHDEAGAAGLEQEAEGPHVGSVNTVPELARKMCWYEQVAAAVQQWPTPAPGSPAVNLYLMPLALM